MKLFFFFYRIWRIDKHSIRLVLNVKNNYADRCSSQAQSHQSVIERKGHYNPKMCPLENKTNRQEWLDSNICMLVMFTHTDKKTFSPFCCHTMLWSSIIRAYVWSAGGHSWTSCLTIPESISQRYYRDLSCCQIFLIPSYQWKKWCLARQTKYV